MAIIKEHAEIAKCQEKNLISALRTALLMTFERFTIPELFINLCNISYLGKTNKAGPSGSNYRLLISGAT